MSTGAAGVETGSQVQSTYTEMNKTDKTDSKKPRYYGKQIGSPVLSEEGEKYYEQLKKKFGNMEFILVSKDMKQQAKTMAASFANPYKTVVLIDEEKIERMAEDEAYRNLRRWQRMKISGSNMKVSSAMQNQDFPNLSPA